MDITKTITEYADEILRSINDDIAEGVVPAGVCSFAELHSHVDANDYTIDADLLPDDDADYEFINDVETLVSRRLASRVLIPGTPVEYEIGSHTLKGTVRGLLPATGDEPMRVVIDTATGGTATAFPIDVKRDSDRCPVCDGETDTSDAVAVWASPVSGTLIAVTCSDECADRLGAHRDRHGALTTAAVPAARATFLARD